MDTVAPTAELEALPPYHDQPTVTLRWSGDDPAPGTGVDAYDLQHRLNGGSWETLLDDTTLTELAYVGVEGARDGARNQGDYSAEVSTIVDLTDPSADLYQIAENSAYAHAAGDTVYYGAGSGGFEVRVSAADSAGGAHTITVGWSGDDPSTGSGQAGAGVAHYDVQVREVLRCALRHGPQASPERCG